MRRLCCAMAWNHCSGKCQWMVEMRPSAATKWRPREGKIYFYHAWQPLSAFEHVQLSMQLYWSLLWFSYRTESMTHSKKYQKCLRLGIFVQLPASVNREIGALRWLAASYETDAVGICKCDLCNVHSWCEDVWTSEILCIILLRCWHFSMP